MEKYIGVKLIEAEPMSEVDFLLEKGDVLADHKNREGYKVKYPDGYVSWSPKSVFEEAYRRTDSMNFGLAVEALKKGYRVARKGWNGKEMWLVLCDFNNDTIIFKEFNDSNECKKSPWIGIKTADNKFVPWVTSQMDVLADDWELVS